MHNLDTVSLIREGNQENLSESPNQKETNFFSLDNGHSMYIIQQFLPELTSLASIDRTYTYGFHEQGQ